MTLQTDQLRLRTSVPIGVATTRNASLRLRSKDWSSPGSSCTAGDARAKRTPGRGYQRDEAVNLKSIMMRFTTGVAAVLGDIFENCDDLELGK
jgi:hypothetical protein